MNENEFYENLKKDLIPKLLNIIEAQGVDVMHAKQIPLFLQKAIDHSIFEHSCVSKFKAYPWED